MTIKKFTLIELIVVIAILGILAAVIIPNVSNFKDEAQEVALTADSKNVQTAVDMYSVQNRDAVPVIGQEPQIKLPSAVDFSKLIPEYLRAKPERGYFWVDFSGTVWASTVDSPTGYTDDGSKISWSKPEGELTSYNIYGVNTTGGKVNYEIKFIETLSKEITEYTYPSTGYEFFIVSATAKDGSESAPIGSDLYTGILAVQEKAPAQKVGYSSDTVPYMDTVYSNEGVTVSAYWERTNEEVWRAFTNGDKGYWGSFGGDAWVQVDYGVGNEKTLEKYTVMSHSTYGDNTYTPSSLKFQAYDESTADWIDLDSQTDLSWVRGETKEFEITNSTSYQKYRVLFGSHPRHFFVEEFHFYEGKYE